MRWMKVVAVGCGVALACAASATAGSLITGAKIKDGTITSRDIKDRSLTGSDVKDQSLTGGDIRNGSITQASLQPGAISAATLDRATVRELTATPATTQVATAEADQDPKQAGLPVTLEPRCPSGQVALGGGGGYVFKPEIGMVQVSQPITDDAGTPVGWRVVIRRASGPTDSDPSRPNTMRAYVVCSP